LFYHVASARIHHFIPRGGDLKGDLLAQVSFYLSGIFVGAPHPSPKRPDRKLNPLQQLTYMALLNILFPFQVLSGVALWGAGRWPAAWEWTGGLSAITPWHNLGSWMLLAFTVGHVYLTTTGHTPLSNLRAMLDGHDQIEESELRGRRKP
jgi:thiosulfate reductase cytochrome b subunit